MSEQKTSLGNEAASKNPMTWTSAEFQKGLCMQPFIN